jgi:putative transposase
MIRSFKIRLKPTKEQEELMIKSCGIMRWAYNYGLQRKIEHYNMFKENLSLNVIRKEIQELKKTEDFKWISEVSSKVYDESLRDLEKSFKNFFNTDKNFPKFKSKKKHKLSFYVRSEHLWFNGDLVNFEKIGKIKFSSNYIFPQGHKICKFTNPRCTFDGKYWYLGFGMEIDEKQVDLNKDLSIGIDLGLKELAVCSNGLRFKNINKTYKMKQLEKKLKRFQRQCSRKYEMNKQGNKFVKTNNIIKLERKIKLIYRRMRNIRMNHIHQATRKIVNEKPYKVVMEDLKVSNMVKNRHLSKAIYEQLWHEFKRQIQYKSEEYGIKFVLAKWNYASSQICSGCGSIDKTMKDLNKRTYVCGHCGLEIDRDLNASINLSKLD